MAEGTTSTAVFECDKWTVTNRDHDVVTIDLWLDRALVRHRAELAAVTTAELALCYVVNGLDVDLDVQEVRGVMQWLHDTYRSTKRLEQETRAARDALLEQLRENRVLPSEMALMASVGQATAERIAGDEVDARLVRSLLHKISAPSTGAHD